MVQNHQDESSRVRSRFEWWGKCTNFMKEPLLRSIIYLARTSASRPYAAIGISIFVAIFLAVVGIFTNFNVVNDGTTLWTPTGCNSLVHGDWISSEESGFPQTARVFQVIVHANGENILGQEGVSRMFDAINVVRSTPGYSDLCSLGRGNTDGECPINSVTGFWTRHNRTLFDEQVQSDEDVILAVSALRFANDEPADRNRIYGEPNPVLLQNASILAGLNETDFLLQSVTAYSSFVRLPPFEEEALPYEQEAINRLFELDRSWANTPGNRFTLELNSRRSFDDELNRGITQDIPLMAVAFILMGVFCAVTLSKWHRVRSQSLVGVGAVATIALALLSGYGLMFCIGVPFSSLTQIFPYVMVGIGLDDTFIITGAFARTDPDKDIADRVEEVMDEVGISISVSTLTTFGAFVLGCLSSLPGIRWFAFYSGPTVLIDFIYQITFFIALLAIDDRRQKANRRDCCPCCVAKTIDDDYKNNDEEEVVEGVETVEAGTIVPFLTKLVDAYSNALLKPATKAVVLVTFSVLLVLGGLGASKQSQKFDFRDLTPPDSYLRDFHAALNSYFGGSQGGALYLSACYFRDLDVSNKENQREMFKFVDDMVAMEYISSQPTSFWLRDFLLYSNQTVDIQDNLTFYDQLDVFLGTEPYSNLYKNDVIRDDEKRVVASRVFVNFDKLDGFDNEQQIRILNKQTQIAEKQTLNQGKGPGDWPVFSFGEIYYAWELYDAIVREILLSFILGLASVFVIALIFIPNPFGAIFVTPVVGIVYVELLAVLWVAGIYVNSVSAVGLTMSIGLVVDYNMHIVLTYFEVKAADTRDEQVKQVMRTIGKSIMLGGFSTFLGVLPLSFSGSAVFRTFFVTFLGIVFLGVGHGLIFTPVVLSLCAPHTPSVSLAEDPVEKFKSDDVNALHMSIQESELELSKSASAYMVGSLILDDESLEFEA